MRRPSAPRRVLPATLLAALVGLPALVLSASAPPAIAMPLTAPPPALSTSAAAAVPAAGAVAAPGDPVVLYSSSAAGPQAGGSGGSPSVVAAGSLTTVPGSPGPALSAWQVTYTGFTPQARAAFQAAVDTWAGIISSPIPITVSAAMTDLGNPQLLGSTGPATVPLTSGGITTVYPLALGNALVGRDLSATIPDIESQFNSAAPGLYFGTDGRPAAGQIDFETIVLHELGHGLGFVGGVDSTGGIGFNDQPLVYDSFTRSPAGPLLAQANGTRALGQQLESGQVTWTGAAAARRNAGTAPLLYAPSTFEPGSSYSHLDEATYPRGTVNSLMTPYLSTQEVVRDPGPITRGLLQDIGWQIASNPSGSIDAITPAPGALRVTGWGVDPDFPMTPIDVHVYLGSRGVPTTANLPRPDLAGPLAGLGPIGAAHGFDLAVSTAGIPAGPLPVCAYGINLGQGVTVSLGCRTVVINHSPIGSFDSATLGPLATTASGWGLDPDTAASSQVHVYVNGRGTATVASLARDDIAAALPGFGSAHGFSVDVAGNRDLPAGANSVCAYGIDTGSDPVTPLGCRTVTVRHDPFGSLDTATAVAGGVRVTGWAVDADTADPLIVAIYDGATGTTTIAGNDRPDIGAAFPATGSAHGYGLTLTAGSGRHNLCAYAINAYSGSNVLLGCQAVTL